MGDSAPPRGDAPLGCCSSRPAGRGWGRRRRCGA